VFRYKRFMMRDERSRTMPYLVDTARHFSAFLSRHPDHNDEEKP
jgi:hypothetical protein